MIAKVEFEMNPFIFDSIKLEQATKLNNVIKVPVVFVSEMVKYYSENGKYYFMPYEEIRDGIKWHQENMPRLPITENHVLLFNENKELRKVKDSELIGYISQLEADDEHRYGKAVAYFTRSKIHGQIADALMRGHVLGVSVGGFNKKYGPPGVFQDQKYTASQMELRFHHAALITIGLPRCPTNMCGFNFSDAKFPWNECLSKMIKRYGTKGKAEKICGSIKAKYSDAFDLIKQQFIDSSIEFQETLSAKAESFYQEFEGKKKKPDKEQIQNHVYTHYQTNIGIKDSYDFSLEQPPEDFKDYHEELIVDGIIPSDSCVRDFWDAYRGTVEWLEYDVINNVVTSFIDNLLSIKNEEAKNKMSEKELEAFKQANESLKAELDGLKNAKFTDAENMIKELQEANKAFADAELLLKSEVETLKKEVMNLKSEEIKTMQKVIFDSKAWTPEEIKAMNYPTLKGNFNVLARLKNNPNQVLRPTPATQYSTLPRPKPGNPISDASGEAPLPPRKWKLGMPPPNDVIMDAENDHWKTRFPKKVS